MKAILLLGSRNPEGQTARAARSLAEGMESDGVETETFYLPGMHIERCRQCDSDGWGVCRQEARCVIGDDVDDLAEAVLSADVTVYATPVYFGDLSESMKTLLDRLRRRCIHEPMKSRAAGRRCIGVCVAGGSGGGAPNCCVILERILQTCGFKVLDMVPVRRQNLAMKRPLLVETGKWLAAGAPE